ncbi:hypothetical protein JCM8202v2_004433 [Rhodotorula sphaerocarpa]
MSDRTAPARLLMQGPLLLPPQDRPITPGLLAFDNLWKPVYAHLIPTTLEVIEAEGTSDRVLFTCALADLIRVERFADQDRPGFEPFCLHLAHGEEILLAARQPLEGALWALKLDSLLTEILQALEDDSHLRDETLSHAVEHLAAATFARTSAPASSSSAPPLPPPHFSPAPPPAHLQPDRLAHPAPALARAPPARGEQFQPSAAGDDDYKWPERVAWRVWETLQRAKAENTDRAEPPARLRRKSSKKRAVSRS